MIYVAKVQVMVVMPLWHITMLFNQIFRFTLIKNYTRKMEKVLFCQDIIHKLREISFHPKTQHNAICNLKE